MSISTYHSGPDINDLPLLIYSSNENVFFKRCGVPNNRDLKQDDDDGSENDGKN